MQVVIAGAEVWGDFPGTPVPVRLGQERNRDPAESAFIP